MVTISYMNNNPTYLLEWVGELDIEIGAFMGITISCSNICLSWADKNQPSL